MEFSGIHLWAVAVAWLVNVVVGALWYSPVGFAKQWIRHTGIDILKIPTNEANKIITAVAFSALVQALTLAVILHSLNIATVVDGLIAGIVLWFGLVAATTVGVTLYSRRSWQFLWLNSSYFLLVMGINSIILTAWR